MFNKIQELISNNDRMTRPTEKVHPSFAKLSINEMRFNQNPRRLSLTMTTNSLPVTQKSIPPGLSKTLTPDSFEHIHNRLKAPTKENYGSKRRINKVLSTMYIHLI